jgi:hypothetical protein
MDYAVEMGSGTTTYIPSFIKIRSGDSKVNAEADSQTHKHTDSIEIA